MIFTVFTRLNAAPSHTNAAEDYNRKLIATSFIPTPSRQLRLSLGKKARHGKSNFNLNILLLLGRDERWLYSLATLYKVYLHVQMTVSYSRDVILKETPPLNRRRAHRKR